MFNSAKRNVSVPKLAARVAVALVVALVTLATSDVALAAPSCGSTDGHYRGAAWSGSGDTDFGTGGTTTSWSSFTVKSGTFSNEAQWIFNPSNLSTQSLEGGFISGHAYNVGWTSYMLPYYTTSNGEYGYVDSGWQVPANAQIYVETTSRNQNADARVSVGVNAGPDQGQGVTMDAGYYQVQTPRTNYAQGEVSADGDTMGGGSGETFTEYWIDQSYGWHAWGGFRYVCQDSPYWAYQLSGSGDQWANGGYG